MTDDISAITKTEVPHTVSESGEATHWSRPMTLSLLNFCREQKEDLHDPSKKKKNIWRVIADAMAAKGYTITGGGCEKKMRNLKQTYKNIKDNNNKTGRGRKSWEFFEILEEIYGKDAAIALPHIVESSSSTADGVDQTPSDSETPKAAGSAQRIRKRPLADVSGSAMALQAIRETEEKKVKVLQDLVRSNDEKTAAIREVNETLKKLLTKL